MTTTREEGVYSYREAVRAGKAPAASNKSSTSSGRRPRSGSDRSVEYIHISYARSSLLLALQCSNHFYHHLCTRLYLWIAIIVDIKFQFTVPSIDGRRQFQIVACRIIHK